MHPDRGVHFIPTLPGDEVSHLTADKIKVGISNLPLFPAYVQPFGSFHGVVAGSVLAQALLDGYIISVLKGFTDKLSVNDF